MESQRKRESLDVVKELRSSIGMSNKYQLFALSISRNDLQANKNNKRSTKKSTGTLK